MVPEPAKLIHSMSISSLAPRYIFQSDVEFDWNEFFIFNLLLENFELASYVDFCLLSILLTLSIQGHTVYCCEDAVLIVELSCHEIVEIVKS